MSRYIGPVRVRVLGDAAVAQRYLAQARKVLGLIDEAHGDAARNAVIRREVEPGVHVTAQYVARDPVLTIDVRRRAPRRDIAVRARGILVVPVSDTLPDGLDAGPEDRDVVILEPVETDDRYLAWFPDTESDEFGRARAARDYAAIYPDGVERFANVDWRGRQGLHCSWWGPHSRYFDEPHLRTDPPPPHVFTRGHLLLDGEQHLIDFPLADPRCEWAVLGAALRRFDGETEDGSTWLYAIHVEPWNDALDPADDADYWQGDHVLIRYPVSTAAAVWEITGPGEALWTQRAEHERAPWHFDRTCTRAVRMQRQEAPGAPWNRLTVKPDEIARAEFLGGTVVTYSTESLEGFPHTSLAGHFRVEDYPVAVDFAPGGAAEAGAERFAYLTLRNTADAEDSIGQEAWREIITLRIGTADVLLMDGTTTTTGMPEPWEIDRITRALLHLDVRHGIVAVARRHSTGSGVFTADALSTTVTPEVWVNGSLFAAGTSHTFAGGEPDDGFIASCGTASAGVEFMWQLADGYEIPLFGRPLGGGEFGVDRDWLLTGAYRPFWTSALDPSDTPGQVGARMVERDGQRWWGAWVAHAGRVMASQVQFGSGDHYLNHLTGAPVPLVTGLTGDHARLFPASVYP